MAKARHLTASDIRGGDIEIDISANGKVIWINIDGMCHLRIQDPDSLKLTDTRKRETILKQV